MQKEPRKGVDNRQEGPGHGMPMAPLFPIYLHDIRSRIKMDIFSANVLVEFEIFFLQLLFSFCLL